MVPLYTLHPQPFTVMFGNLDNYALSQAEVLIGTPGSLRERVKPSGSVTTRPRPPYRRGRLLAKLPDATPLAAREEPTCPVSDTATPGGVKRLQNSTPAV